MVAVMTDEIELSVEFDWRSYAACRDLNYDSGDDPFFIEGHGATYRTARQYCSGCSVVIDCLIEGVSDPDNTGMWGCTSPNERADIREMLGLGYTLKESAEFLWADERKKARGVQVPPKSIWSEWDA
jgi:hypothetical protein